MTAEQVELVQRASVIVTTGGHLPVERRMVELKENGEIAGKILLVEDYKKYGFRYLKEHWYNEKDNPHGVWLDPLQCHCDSRGNRGSTDSKRPCERKRVQAPV
ncbi:TroA family protein [Thermococcus peptonophilus]|uniref:hypothetical protein n=1 Tax=Thermococcus peptonophilus TaxID=53952 RepID=UPI003464F471